MYSKVVVPLDGTDAAERVIAEVKHFLVPGGVIHLLQVMRPSDADGPVQYIRPPREAFGRHLRYGVALVRWHSCTARVVSSVVSNRSVSDGILRYAESVAADLVAMYTRSHPHSATPSRRFIAVDVRVKAPMDVLVLEEADLMPAAANTSVWTGRQ
ncbi:MAG: universal stress protein [Dehalococcoidia bacterium]|nr:universal stress protein [Dehalococcoidia bacterium]